MILDNYQPGAYVSEFHAEKYQYPVNELLQARQNKGQGLIKEFNSLNYKTKLKIYKIVSIYTYDRDMKWSAATNEDAII